MMFMNLLKKVKGIIFLIRPDISIAVGMCVLVGEILALGNIPTIKEALLGFFTAFFISASAMIVNDFFDLEVDKVNVPHRPLPMKILSKNELIFLAIVTTLTGFISAAFLGLIPLGISVVIWLIGFLYNYKLKETGLPGNIIVSTTVAGTFIFGGSAVGAPLKEILLTFSVMAFLFNLGSEIAMDAMDVKGDVKRNISTLAIVFDKNIALIISSVLYMVFILISFIPYVMGWVDQNYLIIVSLIDIGLLYFVGRLLKSKTSSEGRKRVRHLYYTVLFLLIAFIIGVIQT